MLSPEMFDAIARACATGIVDSVVQGTAVALLAFGVVNVSRNRDARSRFAVLFGALLMVAALPFLRLARAGVSSETATSLFRLADAWVPWIAAVWAVCAAAGLLRVTVGVIKLARIRNNCRDLEASVFTPEIAQAVRENSSRRIRLLVSDAITVPSAVGFFRPAVLLPRWVVEELPSSELKHVIVHELSHLRRWDDWTNLLQKIVKALFFFHPAVWWMESRLSLEREIACDDAVVRESKDARSYAECLAHLAERSVLRRSLAMAQAAVSRVRQTSRRVARLLARNDSTAQPFGKYAISGITLLALGAVGVLWRAPELVSFKAQAPLAAANYVLPAPHVGPEAINAAWHMPSQAAQAVPVAVKSTKQAATKPVVRRASLVVRRAPRARMIEAALTTDPVVTSSFLVVVQDEWQVSVWRVTTWHYQPSRQASQVQKTT